MERAHEFDTTKIPPREDFSPKPQEQKLDIEVKSTLKVPPSWPDESMPEEEKALAEYKERVLEREIRDFSQYISQHKETLVTKEATERALERLETSDIASAFRPKLASLFRMESTPEISKFGLRYIDQDKNIIWIAIDYELSGLEPVLNIGISQEFTIVRKLAHTKQILREALGLTFVEEKSAMANFITQIIEESQKNTSYKIAQTK